MSLSTRHKWGDRVEVIPFHKSEQQCLRCGVVKASRHEFDGARAIHWKEFWRELDRLDDGSGTPLCDARLEVTR